MTLRALNCFLRRSFMVHTVSRLCISTVSCLHILAAQNNPFLPGIMKAKLHLLLLNDVVRSSPQTSGFCSLFS